MPMPKPVASVPAKRVSWEYECADNCALVVDGNTLTITVDLSLTRGSSASGKTMLVGSTRGFISLPTHPGVTVSLNVNKKR